MIASAYAADDAAIYAAIDDVVAYFTPIISLLFFLLRR